MSAASTKPRFANTRPRSRRERTAKIDLNTVPSSMELLAESWKGNRG